MKKNIRLTPRLWTLVQVRIFFVLGLLGLQLPMMAQNNTVTGKVTYASGEPIPGVTIVLKGTTNGTTTNADGRFTLNNISTGATLVFSFVGMQTKELPVTGSSLGTVVLEEGDNKLDEVVVVGYGTQKRRDLTGAISSVSAQAIKELLIESVNYGQLKPVNLKSSSNR